MQKLIKTYHTNEEKKTSLSFLYKLMETDNALMLYIYNVSSL